jgi:hypothetical protein
VIQFINCMTRTLQGILGTPEGPQRTAAVAAWIQGLFDERPPVLVGGAAVELYTGGAYTSGDFDFVGGVTPEVGRRLEAEGFSREGRHWIHEKGQVFVEFPSASLDPGDKTATLRVGRHRVLTLRPEALIVDRLSAWQFWNSGIDGVNAYLIWRKRHERLDQRYLGALARTRKVVEALRRLRAFAKRFSKRNPPQEDLEKWANERF